MFTYRKTLTTVCAVLVFTTVFFGPTSLFLETARAQSNDVPIGTDFDFNNIMAHLKDFVLDKAAVVLAKQLLRQLTVSVVNWINSGFNGSPSFLTNPEGFFLNAADQVTGQFLAANGQLSALCSPFSADVRLALALNQTQSSGAGGMGNGTQYTCTLSKIIGNAKGSIDGFTKGDFSQGGWPAFISLTTEPQNNQYGAYLIAQADLEIRIANKQDAINNDLNRGHGFMSWQDCKDVTSDFSNVNYSDAGGEGGAQVSSVYGLDSTQINKLGQSGAQTVGGASGSSIQKTTDQKTGADVYQQCTTQTPGSTIANTLQKNLDIPVDQLNLANDINAVVNALVTQMTSQLISKGLNALSSNTGGKPSYTSQIISQINAQQAAENKNTQDQLTSTLRSSAGNIKSIKLNYDQAVQLITDSKNSLESAKACFVDKLARLRSLEEYQKNYGRTEISLIDSKIINGADPILADLTSKQTGLSNQLTQIENATSTYSSPQSSTEFQGQVQSYEDVLRNVLNATSTVSVTTAQADLKNAQTQSDTLNTNARNFQSICDGFPGDAPLLGF